MCIAIAGGVKGSERNYKELIKKYGFKSKVFNTKVNNFNKKIQNSDAIIVFTKTVSHKMSLECNKICKKKNICLKHVHSSSLSQLEKTLAEIQNEINCGKYN